MGIECAHWNSNEFQREILQERPETRRILTPQPDPHLT